MTADKADVVAWVRAKGVYGGITAEGTSISYDRDANAKYYGHRISPEQIFAGDARRPGAGRLRDSLR